MEWNGTEGNGVEQMWKKRKRISLVNPSIKRTEHLLCARYWEFSVEQNNEGSGPELVPSLCSRARDEGKWVCSLEMERNSLTAGWGRSIHLHLRTNAECGPERPRAMPWGF